MSHRANVHNGYVRTKPFKVEGPKPLHRSFYIAGNVTTNRSDDRWAARHTRTSTGVSRVTCRPDKFNNIKKAVKATRLRQYVVNAVIYIMRLPDLYTQQARELHQQEAIASRS